ncbi:MAG: hypothetical protein FJX76_15850 [Armatimonadetes bacterium]|nr:hypothetical protein [Armatimonadota bacterium]
MMALLSPALAAPRPSRAPDTGGNALETGSAAGGSAGPSLVLQQGHSGCLFDVQMTADGRLMLTLGAGTLKIWDVASRKLLATLPCGGTAIHLSRDGRRAAVISGDEVRVFDIPNAALLGKFPAEGGVALSGDGQTIATGAGQETVLLDAASGKTLRRFAAPCRDPVFSPDGKSLLSGTAWIDLSSGTLRQIRRRSSPRTGRATRIRRNAFSRAWEKSATSLSSTKRKSVPSGNFGLTSASWKRCRRTATCFAASCVTRSATPPTPASSSSAGEARAAQPRFGAR